MRQAPRFYSGRMKNWLAPVLFSVASRRSVALLMPMLMLALVAGTVSAEPAPATGLDSALEQQVRQLAVAATQAATPGVTRVDISVGALDTRLRLAPCQRVEPYLPPGTRLWGKTRIGLRCTQGSALWNVYLPITVKVMGPALVSVATLAAGSIVTPADVIQAEVDLAEDASTALHDSALVVGRTLARPLSAGQSVRQTHLKLRQWFAAGETVQVVAQGSGFSVSGEAQALTAGIEGQPSRVRTESGRVLIGVAVGERKMELTL